MSGAREIAALQRRLENLERRSARVPLRPAGGGGGGVSLGLSIRKVKTLPPVPTEGYDVVFWQSADGGTGDDQIWEAFEGQGRWYPRQKPTDKSGEYVEPEE